MMINNELKNRALEVSWTEDKLSLVICILAILSCSPVIFIGYNSALILFFLFFYLIIFFKLLFEGKAYLKRQYVLLFAFCVTLFLYIAIPFRNYDRFSPSVIWFLVFSTVLFIRREVLVRAFYYFTNLIYYISIASIITLILNAIGVPLPNVIIPREIGGTFTSYYISVRLSGQDYSLFGINLYRLNGIFAEPGHFGLLLCMVLFAYNGIWKTLKGKVILITCFLTLSFGTFTLLLGLLLKNAILEKKLYIVFFTFLALVLAISFVPNEVLERFFLDKADGSLEQRTSNYFLQFYETFQLKGNVLIGEGRDILERNYLRNSDYRGFIIRYGYFGVALYVILISALFFKQNISVKFLGYFYFLVVFMHRSWFIDYFAFLFFLLILSFNLKQYGIKKNI